MCVCEGGRVCEGGCVCECVCVCVCYASLSLISAGD